MSLACFPCWRRNRKQAVEEHAPQANPQTTTEQIHFQQFNPSPHRRSTDIERVDIDDTAYVPANGFLDGKSGLPTYRPKTEIPKLFSAATCVLLTISDVLSTMKKDCYLARCVLFETARLQRPWRSVGPLKLSNDARAVDMQLIKLDKVLKNGNELIQGPWDEESRKKQDLILKGEVFKKALRTAKKSLLKSEKTLNDHVLGELKNGMQSKQNVDYERTVGKVRNLKKELQEVYSRVTTLYREEFDKPRPSKQSSDQLHRNPPVDRMG